MFENFMTFGILIHLFVVSYSTHCTGKSYKIYIFKDKLYFKY